MPVGLPERENIIAADTTEKNDVILLRERQYITQYVTSRASAVREQESLANANVSARQQCVYEGPSEEIYDKLKQ